MKTNIQHARLDRLSTRVRAENLSLYGEIRYNIDMNSATKKRHKIVKQAVANERLEGLKVSSDSKKIADNYIVGKASAKETAAKIRARYGVI